MNHVRTKDLIAGALFGACIAITVALLVTGFALKLKQGEEPEPVVEVYEPEVWRGRVECVYGNSMMYSVDNLVDFIVTAQPAGWMWEMLKEDGTVILYQQPSRIFCSAIPEENEQEVEI
nr:MAG TPA_asm: hypothetical protein [Caudoviricetes sp.]